MPDLGEKKNFAQSIGTYLNSAADNESDRRDVKFLIKRLRINKQKENKGKIIFMVAGISIFVISGIIISF